MTDKIRVGRPPSKKPPSVRATVSIPSETYAIAEALAEQKKVSFAWVVRDALDKYVTEHWPFLGKNL